MVGHLGRDTLASVLSICINGSLLIAYFDVNTKSKKNVLMSLRLKSASTNSMQYLRKTLAASEYWCKEMLLFIEGFCIFVLSLVLKISSDIFFFSLLLWIWSGSAEEEKCCLLRSCFKWFYGHVSSKKYLFGIFIKIRKCLINCH